jgi:hypothetical protein
VTETAKRRDTDAIQAINDEQSRRRSITLGTALAEFVRHPSPWMLFLMLAGGVTARLVHGDWRTSDALLPAIVLAAFPVYEWLVHVFVLHWRPRRVGRFTLDSLLARDHRRHHADPRNIPLIFIPWRATIWIVVTTVAISVFAFGRLGLGLTFLVVNVVIALTYEWVHFLIHTDYRPVTRLYRAIWNNHRLHHYKNEHYWFNVTTSGTADRLFGTHPDPASVTKSRTARNLHALSDVGEHVVAGIIVAVVLAATVLAGVAGHARAAGAADVQISGPFRPYFPPPFAHSCTVHHFGEGVAPPLSGIPDDPLCVDYAKRDITITDGGAIRFLAAEPARVLVAVTKCQYWQQDHWSVQFAPGQLPLIRWDGNYWWDLGTGQAGARLANLRIGGVPVGATQLARVVAPFSPALAAYFAAFGQGGTGAGYVGHVPFNPSCAK